MKNTNDLSFEALIPSSKSDFERNIFQYVITMNCIGTYTSMDQLPDPTIKVQILQSRYISIVKLHILKSSYMIYWIGKSHLQDRKESHKRIREN